MDILECLAYAFVVGLTTIFGTSYIFYPMWRRHKKLQMRKRKFTL